jgi:hypothetical protein
VYSFVTNVAVLKIQPLVISGQETILFSLDLRKAMHCVQSVCHQYILMDQRIIKAVNGIINFPKLNGMEKGRWRTDESKNCRSNESIFTDSDQ